MFIYKYIYHWNRLWQFFNATHEEFRRK